MRFFDNVFSVFDNRQLNVESTKRDIDYKCMFKIPFVGLVSHEFKKKVINLFFHDLGVEIFPIFKSCKLSGFFSLKSQTPKELIANAVYKYTGWETTLDPPPQPQLQTSQEIYTYSIKILSMSDSGAKFHEDEVVFHALKRLFK